jgi:dipeptidase E
MPRRLLLLSNSRDPAGNYLKHPQRQIRAFLGARVKTALLVPFAGVTTSLDDYAACARAPFAEMGYELASVHDAPDPPAAVRAAEAIVVGGGNTFHLLARLYETGLLEVIRERVRAGVSYVGWSAGSVVACPTIKTTNDMPIIEPPSLAALGLVPFQINAHYTDFHPPGFRGETRAERIAEFLAVNPELTVVGLPEGTMLQVEKDRMALHGEVPARVFVHGREPAECRPGEPLDALLEES